MAYWRRFICVASRSRRGYGLLGLIYFFYYFFLLDCRRSSEPIGKKFGHKLYLVFSVCMHAFRGVCGSSAHSGLSRLNKSLGNSQTWLLAFKPFHKPLTLVHFVVNYNENCLDEHWATTCQKGAGRIAMELLNSPLKFNCVATINRRRECELERLLQSDRLPWPPVIDRIEVEECSIATVHHRRQRETAAQLAGHARWRSAV